MNIGLLSILHTKVWDFRWDSAHAYGDALRSAIEAHVGNADADKQQSFFLSTKRGLSEKLYVGNIHRIENHLYYNDEELAEDDQIVNVVMMVGPVTRDGGACSYGTKDLRDQVIYANTIPQVVGHVFYVNTPGGESASRNDYEQLIQSCREKGKPVVTFVDGMCCSSGVNFASRTDRVIVMNPRDDFGCIGSMAAFWATPDGAIDRDGSRWVEIVGEDCPEKNDWWRDAAKGEYDKLQARINKSTKEFHQSVHENRPLTKDWMLTGEVFEAQQLIPALVDEIGDFNRAIECVFELAGGTMPAARFAEAPATVPDASPSGDEPEQPLNSKDMTKEEEMKAQEAAAAQAAAQEAVEQPAEQEETPAAGEAPAETPAAEEPAAPEAPAAEEPAATVPEGSPEGEQPAEEPAATEEPAAEAQAEIDKIQETLHNAETMIADKDKTIAGLKEALEANNATIADRDKTIETLNGDMEGLRKGTEEKDALIAERDKTIADLQATIEAQKKQLAEKEAEIKELADKPAPMTDAAAGVPAGNGTGEAPKQKQCKGITRDMSYEEIRAAKKQQ